jgi:hypothetical protein
VYEGYIQDGKKNGRGTLTLIDGEIWQGEFQDGVMNG